MYNELYKTVQETLTKELMNAFCIKAWHSWDCSLTFLRKSQKITALEIQPSRKPPQKFIINQTITKYEAEQPEFKGFTQANNLS